jgi:membrane associated rhomboid family serine protease
MEPSVGPSKLDVLRWVADQPEGLWFPSRYASAHGLNRDSLDSPLNELRLAEWIAVAAWEKGLGQGYRVTPAGQLALNAGEARKMPVHSPQSPAQLYEDEELPAVASPALLFANLTWFAIGMFTAWRMGVGVEFLKGDGHPGAVQALFKTGAVTGLSVLQGDWWRLVSSCFVHVGLFHLAANMLTLGMLGPVVEALWGKRRFAVIYGVSGIVGSAVAVALHPQDMLAGASGALWGVLAAMVAWLLGHRNELRPGIAADWGRKIALILFINILISFAPEVSMAAHLGGGVAGFLTSLCLDWPANKSKKRKLRGILGTGLVLVAGLLFLVGSIRYSNQWDGVRERNRLHQLDRDRSKMQAAVGERLGKVNLVAVYALMMQAKDPLWLPLPKSAERVREKARDMKAAAEDASVKSQSVTGPTADRYRAYFECVAAFAESLDADLAKADIPTILEKLQAADAAWMKAIGK